MLTLGLLFNYMIYIKYFARYRELLGLAQESYDLVSSPVSVQMIKEAVRVRHTTATSMLDDPRCIVAINQKIAGVDDVVNDGDEVAFFPPVTGG